MDKHEALDWFLRRRSMALDDKCQDAEDIAIECIMRAIDGDWIMVEDRLPDMLEPFWAACKSLTDERDNWTIEGIYKGTTFGGPWGVPIVEMGKAEVYAWKPKEIPEPPKEEGTK